MADEQTIHPIDVDVVQTAPHLTIESYYKADDGSEWLRMGDRYEQIVAPWVVADHIGPVRAHLSLGDVASWVQYVTRYADEHRQQLLMTWSDKGLRAVLDHHQDLATPGRAQWIAEHPFITSEQWNRWTALADGKTRWTQQQAVDQLDALADDIVTPVASKVLDIIRTLRSSVKMEAKSVLREDGGSEVSFSKDSSVTGKTAIPPVIEISIPVLKGHTTEQDGVSIPVLYSLPVNVRPSVDDSTHTLGFRFLMPTAERVLEAVYADRVTAAKALLGELGASLYRATA